MGNVKLKKFIAVAMVAIMSVSILTGCSEESESTAKKKTSKTESSDLPSFQVKAPSGNYAKLKDEYSEDEYSEEIDELMNNKHIIDETFDDTEYLSECNDGHKGSWGIYIYMCGSDLESENGAATADIQEIISSDIPENVNVVIETGGATAWNNEIVDPNYLERYVYNSEAFDLVDSEESKSMGDKDTLSEFLQFCNENFPADNKMVIFWNHGGGSLGGVCYDEIYDLDHLTLNEIDEAFTEAFGEDRIEAIGFDCCLMGSVDTANICKNHAKMMIASEESEPGNGWYYTGWLDALGKNTKMSNAKLGKEICDSFYEGCEEYGTESKTTLSAIDLNKINLVVEGMNMLSTEMYSKVYDDGATAMSDFGRAAVKTENYGSNTDTSGYFDLLDIGDFLKQSEDLEFDSREMLEEAIDKAVIYNVHGKLRSNATGVSMYYPYDKSLASQQKYESVAASDLYASFNRLMLLGDMDDESYNLLSLYCDARGAEQMEDTDAEEIVSQTEGMTFTNDDQDLELVVDDEGYLSADIGAENIQAIESVTGHLFLYLEDSDTFLSIGTDNDVSVDWDSGVIRDNFRGVGACFDGEHYLYMDLCDAGDGYNIYSVPIKLNGERKNMTVAYYFDTEEYEMIGISEDTSGHISVASKEMSMPHDGDTISTIFYYYDSETEDWEETELESFQYNSGMEISEEDYGDGEYGLMFSTEDVSGNQVYTNLGYISYQDGEMEAYIE